jgi:hypothetical protein
VSEQPPRRGKRAATSPESRSSPRRSRSRGGTSGSNRTPAGSGMATQERRWGGDGGRGMWCKTICTHKRAIFWNKLYHFERKEYRAAVLF